MNPATRIAIPMVLGICLLAGPALAAGRGEPGPVFPASVLLVDEEADLLLLHRMDIDIDTVLDGLARVYLVPEELAKLRHLGFEVRVLPDDGPAMAAMAQQAAAESAPDAPAAYHTFATLTADLQQVADDHPEIVRKSSIGESVEGRDLWMMKITDNPDVEEDEPEVLYIAAMHGDEVVGKEICLYLIDLLTDEYGVDPRITDLVDGTEIWILPSMNPDGTEAGRRYNANNRDLNRNFPDEFDDPVNTIDGREPETRAVMLWGFDHTTDLSGNMHGGALVVNYPRDGNPGGASVYSPSPDDSAFVSVSRTYADNNPPLSVSNGHSSWNNGICNGADWYAINGGMQDWNYVWRGNMDVTLEISTVKWPPANELSDFWDDNRESMLAYFERVHEGVRGIVTDAMTGLPLEAEVRVDGSDYPFWSDPDVGDYHRILLPGAYLLEFSATGYNTALVEAHVTDGEAVRYDVALDPLDTDLQPVSACTDTGGGCDPWLDPDVPSDLAVTLRNLGLEATNVYATVEPTGWFAEVWRESASYPDLSPGDTGQSAAPHHGVTVLSSAPAGHRAGFAVRWESDQGSGWGGPFFLPVGPASCPFVDSLDVPQPIRDRQTSESTLQVTDDLEISDIRVTVDISHTYTGELRVELVSPAGSPVALHNHSGGPADDILGTYGDDLTPFEPLTRVHGESSLGTWTLRINDGSPGDEGTLNAWSLEACGRPFEAAPPEMRFRSVDPDPGGVLLEWWPYPGMTSYRVYRSTDPSDAGSFTDVTSEDGDDTDTRFVDSSAGAVLYWLVSGVGPQGEGPR